MRHKSKFGLKSALVIVAISAIAFWAGLNWSPWPASLRDWRIQRHLNQTISLRYPEGIPLFELLGEIKRQTRGLDSPMGLTICVDPEGLQDADQAIDSVVKIDVKGVMLKDALRSGFEPLGLTYFVKDGIILITHKDLF